MTPNIDLLTKLNFILDFYKTSGKMQTCKIVADHLRKQLSPEPSWGASYIHMASTGKINISEKLKMAIQVEYYSIRQDISEIELERVEIFAPIGFIKPGTICVQKPNFCVRCHQEYFSNNSIEGICPVCRLKDKHKKIIISNHSNCPRDVSGSMPEADANIDLLGEPEVLVNPESAREISGCWIPDSALSSENLFKDNDAECFHGVE